MSNVQCFPKNKVIGSGTVLDTARFKYLIGDHVGIDPRNVHAYILGEHGDTEVATWSLTNIAGIPMEKFCEDCKKCKNGTSRKQIYENVKNAAYHIIERKGATYYAIALSVKRIVEAIVRDEDSILTVSSFLEGQYGLSDVCLSVPTLINKDGVDKILTVPISEDEQKQLIKSGNALKEVIKSIEI